MYTRLAFARIIIPLNGTLFWLRSSIQITNTDSIRSIAGSRTVLDVNEAYAIDPLILSSDIFMERTVDSLMLHGRDTEATVSPCFNLSRISTFVFKANRVFFRMRPFKISLFSFVDMMELGDFEQT